MAVCRIVNAENGEVNGDTNALTPSSWDCISLTIYPGFGEEEKEYKKNMLLKNIDIRRNSCMGVRRCRVQFKSMVQTLKRSIKE